jgi:hypothetical protein
MKPASDKVPYAVNMEQDVARHNPALMAKIEAKPPVFDRVTRDVEMDTRDATQLIQSWVDRQKPSKPSEQKD